MVSQEYLQKMEVRQNYRNVWHTDLVHTMQTQHKVEMDKRDGKFGPQPAMAVPPVQQMSRIEQPYPPTVGYPPPQSQPAYGYPPQTQPGYGYPPPGPQPQAYPPPSGYPPAGYPH